MDVNVQCCFLPSPEQSSMYNFLLTNICVKWHQQTNEVIIIKKLKENYYIYIRKQFLIIRMIDIMEQTLKSYITIIFYRNV